MSSTAEKLQFTGVISQGRRSHLCVAQSILPSDFQIDKFDLPAVIFQRGADEAKYLLKDAQTGCISVDGSRNGHQHQAMWGGEGPKATGLQVGAEEEMFFPG